MIEKQYRQYYIFGYLNYDRVSRAFVKKYNEENYVNRKIRKTLAYLGFTFPEKDYTHWAKVISVFELIASVLIITGRFIILLTAKLFVKNETPKGLVLLTPQTWASFRVKDMLRSFDETEVSSVHIPFIKNSYKHNEISILSVVRLRDIIDSFVSGIRIIFFMKRKFGKKDILFRSYASFEFFLTCRFIQLTENENRFIYFNTFDRWAFLFCHAKTEVIFLQHGKLDYITTLIRVGTPDIAYYISPEQKQILEDTLFENKPRVVHFRKMLQFTDNEVLNYENGKKNVLIVSAMLFSEAVVELVPMLAGLVNIYIKPHPGEKEVAFYDNLVSKYGVKILTKTAYPKVDVVLSYNSTLADEYELAGVSVIRWDLIKDLSKVKTLVLKKENK